MRPIILAIGGHDPTGGAGIQADIETIGQLGGQAVTIPTAITLQNSHQVVGFEPVAAHLLSQQGRMLLEEFPIAAIKIGMVANVENCEAIQALLRPHPEIPLLIDPVLAGGGGGTLSRRALAESIRTRLLPLAMLSTPNRSELQQLVPEEEDLEACASALHAIGCHNLLVTGTDHPLPGESTAQVYHQLYQKGGAVHPFNSPRLPHHYHGSGCTLSSAITTRIAQGAPLQQAIMDGLAFTRESLQHGSQPAEGQYFPHRLFRQQAEYK